MSTAIIFKKNPIEAICAIVTFPDENTIALGGVLTGIINAQLAAKVKGMVS